MFLSYPYCLWEKHIGKTYCLSCCEMRYSFGMKIQSFLFKVLGEFSFAKIKIKKIHRLTYSSMVTEIPTKAKISCYILKPFYFCCLLLHWVLSSFVDPCQEIYHAFKTKITYTPPNICITPTLGVGARHTFHLGSTKKKVFYSYIGSGQKCLG